MIIDCNRYRANIPTLLALTKDQNAEERRYTISTFAVATHVPIIVVACYMGELYGFTAEIDDIIDYLCKFYKVTQVLNYTR